VIGYFCVSAVVMLAVIALGLLEGSVFWIVVGGLGALYVVVEARIYVPRALQAARRVGSAS
jgi:hypothetical protein